MAVCHCGRGCGCGCVCGYVAVVVRGAVCVAVAVLLWLRLWLWLCCCGCVSVAVWLWLWLWLWLCCCGCVYAVTHGVDGVLPTRYSLSAPPSEVSHLTRSAAAFMEYACAARAGGSAGVSSGAASRSRTALAARSAVRQSPLVALVQDAVGGAAKCVVYVTAPHNGEVGAHGKRCVAVVAAVAVAGLSGWVRVCLCPGVRVALWLRVCCGCGCGCVASWLLWLWLCGCMPVPVPV